MKLSNAVQAVSRGFVFLGIASAVVSVAGFRSISSAARPAELVSSDRGSQINVRSSSSVWSEALHYGFSGDRVQILHQQQGDDGRLWYYIQFDRSGASGWVRSDLVHATDTQPITTRSIASRPVVNQPLPNPLSNQIAKRSATEVIAPPKVTSPVRPSSFDRSIFTQEQINYFMEIAMGSEFDSNGNPQVRKWRGDIRIQYSGTPTKGDLTTLNTVISELNSLTGGSIHLRLDNNNPNITIHFVPESQFRKYEPRYVPTNYGFFATDWDASGTIQKANILINSQDVTQRERSHLIREELTQSLGLMRDSFKYPLSMFYQPWTDVTQYAEIDKALIRMLYDPSIQAGMTKAEVLSTLKTLQASRSAPVRF
jgi:hypothetical protein